MCAGGIDPRLRAGTVVVPEFVIDAEGGSQGTDPEWRDRLLTGIRSGVPISTGAILHAEEIVASVGEKRILHQRWRAAAVDMESIGVARVARDSVVPWLVVRVVADAADRALPKSVSGVSGDDGRLRIGGVLGLAARPWVAGAAGARAGQRGGGPQHAPGVGDGRAGFALGEDRNS